LPSSAGSMSMWTILASGAKAATLPGHAVVEAGPEGHEQVGALHGGDGGVVAVHAGHAEAEGMGVGEGAAAHEVVTTGMPVRVASSKRASAPWAFSIPPPA